MDNVNFNLENFLKLEDNGEILSYRFKDIDIPIWLIIRNDLFFFYYFKIHKLENAHIKIDPFSLSIKQKIDYLYKSFRKNPFIYFNKKYDILIFGAGINNVPEDGAFFNRLYDDFWDIMRDEILLIENSNKFTYPSPRYNQNLCYEDIILIFTKIYKKLFKSLKNDNYLIIEEFLSYLKSSLKGTLNLEPENNELMYFKKMLINIYKGIKFRKNLYRFILKRYNPNLIIIEDAHYLVRIDLITTAKELGIKVAEFQHGFIGKEHNAYNYNPKIFRQISKYLPDYMLYWGEYWAEKSQVPGKKVIIGFPYLEKKAKNQSYSKNKLLLCSSGTIPQDYLDFGLQLINALKDKNFEFYFRPHPSERPALYERYSKLLEAGFKLDLSNLYESLSSTKILISLEPTTVLYEAIPFCELVIMVKSKISNLYYESDMPFLIVEKVDEVVNLILQNKKISKTIRNRLFNPNWLENWNKFINEVFNEG